MLYVGHFSFTYDAADGSPAAIWHGHFATVVESANADTAIESFRTLITGVHSSGVEWLSRMTAVYLDSCSEIQSIPQGGFISWFQLRPGDDSGGVGAGPHGASVDQVVAVALEPDVTRSVRDGEAQRVPFVTFTPAPSGIRSVPTRARRRTTH